MGNVINKEMLLTQKFAGQIRNKVDHEKIQLQTGYEYRIAKGFLDLLIGLKKELKNSPYFPSENNKTNWTPEIDEKIFILYQQLKQLFSPIEGGCRPDKQSAYWSSDGRKAAEKIGTDFAHTVIGSVLNQVLPSIQTVITRHKKKNDKIESAFNFIIWSALSRLYIEETTNDAYIFLADGEVHCQSVFWNIELHALREKQHSGNIQHLFLYTLQPHAMQQYQRLLKIRDTSQSSLFESMDIQTEIDAIVTNNNNWHYELLDTSSLFKIRINKNKTIKFQSLKTYASFFYKNNLSIQASKVINTLKKNKYPDKILSAAIKIMNLNNFNKKTNNYMVIIPNYRDIEQLNLVFNEKVREYSKKMPVFARKVCPFEIGSELVTYISDPSASSGYKVETTCQLSEDMVIVRNMIELCNSRGDACRDREGNIIYNEYAMGKSVFLNSYTSPDQLLECFSQKFYKKTTIRAIEIDEQVISILHEHDQSNHSLSEDIFIATNWGTGDTVELLRSGGMLTDSGYAIAKEEFAATYAPVNKGLPFFNTASSRACRENELETVKNKKIAIKVQ